MDGWALMSRITGEHSTVGFEEHAFAVAMGMCLVYSNVRELVRIEATSTRMSTPQDLMHILNLVALLNLLSYVTFFGSVLKYDMIFIL